MVLARLPVWVCMRGGLVRWGLAVQLHIFWTVYTA